MSFFSQHSKKFSLWPHSGPLTFTLCSFSLLCLTLGTFTFAWLIFFTMTCLWTQTHCVKSSILSTFCSTRPFVFFEVWCWHLETHQELDYLALLSSALFLRKALFLFQTSFCAETINLLCLIMLLLFDDEAFLGKPDLPCHARWAAFSRCACFLTRLKACFWHPATVPVIPPAACVPCRRKEAGDLAIATLPWATGSLPAAEGLLVWSHGRNSARRSSPRHKRHTGLGLFVISHIASLTCRKKRLKLPINSRMKLIVIRPVISVLVWWRSAFFCGFTSGQFWSSKLEMVA